MSLFSSGGDSSGGLLIATGIAMIGGLYSIRYRADPNAKNLIKNDHDGNEEAPELLVKELRVACDGYVAIANMAFMLSDIMFILPFSHSNSFGDVCDGWAQSGEQNVFGKEVSVNVLCTRAAVVGAVRGAISSGSLVSVMGTSSGFSLLLPELYAIANSKAPCVMHISVQSIAEDLTTRTDLQEIMTAKQTGFAFLASNSVQEGRDMALVAQLASLRTSVPFIHFFDGTRIVNEVAAVSMATPAYLKSVLQEYAADVNHQRNRAVNKNLETDYEMSNDSMSAFNEVPYILDGLFKMMQTKFGRQYGIFEYSGHEKAEHVVVTMGTPCVVFQDMATSSEGKKRKIGVVSVRVFRPWSVEHFLSALPKSVTTITVLDNTSTSNSVSSPLLTDVLCSVSSMNAKSIAVLGGTFGGDVEFTPSLARTIFDNMSRTEPRTGFTLQSALSAELDQRDSHRSLPLTNSSDESSSKKYREIILWGCSSLDSSEQLIGRSSSHHLDLSGTSTPKFEAASASAIETGARQIANYVIECASKNINIPSNVQLFSSFETSNDIDISDPYAIDSDDDSRSDSSVNSHVTSHTTQGCKNEVVNVHLRLSNETILAPYRISAGAVVVVTAVDLFRHYDIVSSVERKGTIAITFPREADLDTYLPHHVKTAIAQKRLSLYLLSNTIELCQASRVTASEICAGLALRFGYPSGSTKGKSLYARFSNEFPNLSAELDNLKPHRIPARWYSTSVKISDTRALNSITVDRLSVRKFLNGTIRPRPPAELYAQSNFSERDSDSNSTRSSEEESLGSTSVDTYSSTISQRRKLGTKSVSNNEWGADLKKVPSAAERTSRLEKHFTDLYTLFPEAFQTSYELSSGPCTHLCPIIKIQRLTPYDYDRNIFHMEIDISGTDLTYSMGDALAVHPRNDSRLVSDFKHWYGLDGDRTISIITTDGEVEGDAVAEVLSINQILTQVLDIFGKVPRKFYKSLAEYASGHDQVLLEHIASDAGKTEFDRRAKDTTTFYDILDEFKSARPSFETLVEMIPRIKPRLYSISSSSAMYPNEVHLLVVVDDWTTSTGQYKVGLSTNYLNGLKANGNELLAVSIKPSLMKMPSDPMAPVVMCGTGTGMAPFRSFVQERAVLKRQGIAVGPMTLYFGARYKAKEFLYGDELQKYHEEGVLTHIRCAWSRDQSEKVYVQHKVGEDANVLHDYLIRRKGGFYLCGQAGAMPNDVFKAMVDGFSNQESGTLTGKTLPFWRKKSEKLIEHMKEEGRFVLEVY